MMHLVVLGLLCCTTTEGVPSPTMRKQRKVNTNVMSVGPLGLVEEVSPQPPKPQMRRMGIKDHTYVSVDSSGDASLQLNAKGEALGDTGGPVAEALYNAKAELANQITEHQKALSDTNLALTRAEEDKAQKQAALEEALRMYNLYLNRHKALQAEIANVTNRISTLTNLSLSQQSEIDRLTALHDAKHDAAKTAEDLEALVVSLTGQINSKEKAKAESEAEHIDSLSGEVSACDSAIKKFEGAIQNLTARIDETQAQYDLLTELHTALSCSEKEVKNQRICKRCTVGEPCGDTCITADQKCHHDPGCACKADGATDAAANATSSTSNASADATSASLLEDKPSAHPLQKTLQDAKAALRKVIAQHQDTMDNLRAGIVANEGQVAEMQIQKRRAIADFEASLKALSDEKLQLEAAHKVSKANKIKAEEDLRKAISEGTAAIDQLAQELKDSIAELTAERTRTQNARTSRVTTCEEERKAMLDAQSNTISSFDAEVSQLNQQKSDAHEKLVVLRQQHNVTENADQGTDSSHQGSSDHFDQVAHTSDSAGADNAGAADSQGNASASDSVGADGTAAADSEGGAPSAGDAAVSNSAAANGSAAAGSQGDAVPAPAASLDCSGLTGGSECGEPKGDWIPKPGVKGCSPRLIQTKGTTCKTYCGGKGFDCLRAQDNVGSWCVLDPRHHRQDTSDHGCNQKWKKQICECGKK